MKYSFFLNNAKINQNVQIKSLNLPLCFQKRLSSLGFFQKAVLRVLSVAPFLGMLQIATPFGIFCIRQEVAKYIEVTNV